MKKIYLSIFFLLSFLSAKSQWVADTNVCNAICTAANYQLEPQICTDGHKGAIMCWSDLRNGSAKLYAQRIDSSGVIKWTVDGIMEADTTPLSGISSPDMITDNSGGAIICYELTTAGVPADYLYAIRIDGNGNLVWPSKAIIDMGGDARKPRMKNANTGEAVISWYRYTPAAPEVFVQWMDKNGTMHLPQNGLQITNNIQAHYHSKVTYAGDSTAYVTWTDYDTLRITRFDSTGNILWNTPVTLSNSFSGNENDYAVVSNSNHDAIIYWNDIRSVSPGFYVQRISSTGNPTWSAGGNAIDISGFTVSSISVASDGSTGNFVAYSNGNKINIQHIDINGQNLFSQPLEICSTGGQSSPVILRDGSNGAIIAWQDGRGGNGVYAQRIDANGNLLWRDCGVPVSTHYNGGTANSLAASSTNNGKGIALFLNSPGDVYCAKIENNIATGMIEVNNENIFKVYPDPSNGNFKVQLNKFSNPVELTIADLSGRKLEEYLLQKNNSEIKTNLLPGIYLLSIVDHGKNSIKKMIIE